MNVHGIACKVIYKAESETNKLQFTTFYKVTPIFRCLEWFECKARSTITANLSQHNLCVDLSV